MFARAIIKEERERERGEEHSTTCAHTRKWKSEREGTREKKESKGSQSNRRGAKKRRQSRKKKEKHEIKSKVEWERERERGGIWSNGCEPIYACLTGAALSFSVSLSLSHVRVLRSLKSHTGRPVIHRYANSTKPLSEPEARARARRPWCGPTNESHKNKCKVYSK